MIRTFDKIVIALILVVPAVLWGMWLGTSNISASIMVGSAVLAMYYPAEYYLMWSLKRRARKNLDRYTSDVEEANVPVPVEDSPMPLPFGAVWVRTLEEFEGPILRQYEGVNGEVLLEKWCGQDKDGRSRFFFVRSTQEEINLYLEGKITMRSLLTDGPNKRTYFIVEKLRGVVQTVIPVPADSFWQNLSGYLPQPHVHHDVTLRPEDDISIN